jgi:hypothetical protein
MTETATWPGIYDKAKQIYALEGQDLKEAHAIMLANMGFSELSDLTGYYCKSWTSGQGASDINFTNGKALFPKDMLRPIDMTYQTQLLERVSIREMTARYPGWRTNQSTPTAWCGQANNLTLNTTMAIADGDIVLQGEAYLPYLKDGKEVEADDPFTYLPEGTQIMIVYYILAKLPVDPEQPVSMARRDQWQREWQVAIERLVNLKMNHSYRAFRP